MGLDHSAVSYDIVTGLVAFFISIFVFMALPIIPIRKAYKEQSME